MLDYVMLQHLPGSIYSDSIYRCPSCGQGPVMAGDGFLMNRCLNCGRYQHATDLGRCDLSWVRRQVAGVWQRIKRCFASGADPKVENASGLNLSCELEGGMK
jgi:ribosomal protein L37AE/L43A